MNLVKIKCWSFTCLYRFCKLLQSLKRLKALSHVVSEFLTQTLFGELHAASHETGPVHGLNARCWKNSQWWHINLPSSMTDCQLVYEWHTVMTTVVFNHLFTDGAVVALPTLGLGLSTMSKPLTSRAQFSCRSAAHGTVREIVWMNPAVTSKGASAVSRSSLRDCEKRHDASLSSCTV